MCFCMGGEPSLTSRLLVTMVRGVWIDMASAGRHAYVVYGSSSFEMRYPLMPHFSKAFVGEPDRKGGKRDGMLNDSATITSAEMAPIASEANVVT